MNQTLLRDRWGAFLPAFYQEPNRLALGRRADLDEILEVAGASIDADPPRPVLVPLLVGPSSEYVAIGFSNEQASELRSLITANIGPSWSNFDGRPLSLTGPFDKFSALAVELAGGDAGWVFRFSPLADSKPEVRAAVARLMRTIREVPPRDASLAAPLGRLLGDFDAACARGWRFAAEALLERLSADHRVSAMNRLFLRVQFLSAFEDWDGLKSLADEHRLVDVARPSMVSDALARLALHELALAAPDDVALQTVEYFGPLIGATSAIRSVEGAAYYLVWCILRGEPRSSVKERVASAGWDLQEYADLPVLSGNSLPDVHIAPTPPTFEEAQRAHDECRWDSAAEILLALPVDVKYLPLVVDAAHAADTTLARDLLGRYLPLLRQVVDEKLDGNRSRKVTLPEISAPFKVDALRLWNADLPLNERTAIRRRLAEIGAAEAVADRFLEDVADGIRQRMAWPVTEVAVDEGIDSSLELATMLRASGETPTGLVPFGVAVLEMWAHANTAVDRRRLEHIADLLVDVLTWGVTPDDFKELIEILRAGWTPFITDIDTAMGVELIESLLSFCPGSSDLVLPFAQAILVRIGHHNARRVGLEVFDVARLLSGELGIASGDEGLPDESPQEATDTSPLRGRVLVYSLMRDVADRAKELLSQRHPHVTFEVNDDRVSTKRLRAAVRGADVVVIVDRAAKHAATRGIIEALNGRSPVYSLGRGAASIMRAVEAQLALLAASAA